MIIGKRRIRSLKANISHITPNTKLIVGVKHDKYPESKFINIGFTKNCEFGECVLPQSLGTVSDFNCNGRYDKQKDQPLETAYRHQIWDYNEWHGKKRVPKSKIVDIPYERYPRTFVKPPSIELTIAETLSGDKVVVSPIMEYYDDNPELLHVINLFLELFGECYFFTQNLNEIIDVPVKRLNWEVLPPGPMPWPRLFPKLKPVINDAKKGNRRVATYRLRKIEKYGPDFCAIGNAGFSGYVVFGFKDKNIYIFESVYQGNATYVFDNEWEELSKKSKSEILDDKLQKDRVIHTKTWGSKINQILN